MLGLSNIQDIIDRIRLQDTNFEMQSKDAFGDIIEAYDSTTEFNFIREKIMGNPYYNDRVVDNGYNFIEIHDNIYVDGDKVKVAILIEDNDVGTGTVIKMMVKHICHDVDGEMKHFLGFESMKNYINRIAAPTED